MDTGFTISADDLSAISAEFNAALAQDPSMLNVFGAAYAAVLAAISEKDANGDPTSNPATGVPLEVYAFFEAAASVNQGDNDVAASARVYSALQHEIRVGAQLDPNGDLVNGASNAIAEAIIRGIIDSGGALPTIESIAEDDAANAAAAEFDGDFLFGENDVGGWVGNPLFVPFGHIDSWLENVVAEERGTYDLLAAIVAGVNTFDDFQNPYSSILQVLQTGSDTVGTLNFASLGVQLTSSADDALTAAYDIIPFNLSDVLLGPIGSLIFDVILPDTLENVATRAITGNISLGTINDDIIDGANSNQFQNTTNGNDIINTGKGDDVIFSNEGRDLIDGGDGFDAVNYSGEDGLLFYLYNQPVTSAVKYTGTVYTGSLFAALGAIPIVGNVFHEDVLYNIEAIIGSESDDTFFLFQLEDGFSIDGGDGVDFLSFLEAEQPVQISVEQNSISNLGVDYSSVTLTSIEGITGSNFDDIVMVNSFPTVFGNNLPITELSLGRGDGDTVDFSAVDAVLTASGETPTFLGSLLFGEKSRIDVAADGSDIVLSIYDAEHINFGKQDDIVDFSAFDGGIGLYGGEGADTVTGGAGDDILGNINAPTFDYSLLTPTEIADIIASEDIGPPPGGEGNSEQTRLEGGAGDDVYFIDYSSDFSTDTTHSGADFAVEDVDSGTKIVIRDISTGKIDTIWLDEERLVEIPWTRPAFSVTLLGDGEVEIPATIPALTTTFYGFFGEETGAFYVVSASRPGFYSANVQGDSAEVEFESFGEEGEFLSPFEVSSVSRYASVKEFVESAEFDPPSEPIPFSYSPDEEEFAPKIGNDARSFSVSLNGLTLGELGQADRTDVGLDLAPEEETDPEPYVSPDATQQDNGDGTTTTTGTSNNDTLLSFAGGQVVNADAGDDTIATGMSSDTINAGEGDDYVVASGGDDVIIGGAGNDTLNGGLGADSINGGDGIDQIFGNQGADILTGGVGDDSYFVSRGEGNDTIIETNVGDDGLAGSNTDNDELNLFGFNSANIELNRQLATDDLIVRDTVSGEEVRIVDHFAGDAFGVEKIIFDSGLEWDRTAIETLAVDVDDGDPAVTITGTENGETIDGTIGDDVIDALAGDDLVRADDGNDFLFGREGSDDLRGEDGDDFIVGGADNDDLSGGQGSDTYRFGANDGNDLISDVGQNADTDRILFDNTVALSELSFARGATDTYDLVITNNVTGDTLTVDRNFVGANRGIEEIEFMDGTILTADDIASATSPYVGTAGDDVFYGKDVDEDITGAGGNDELRGAKGSDTYRFGANDGADLITDVGQNADTDRIVFDNSVALGDLTFTRGVDDTYDLVITNNVTGASISIDRHFVGANRGIEEIEFSDGTVLSGVEIAAAASPYMGTAGADTFYGTDADEDITGAAGDDELRGAKGSDTYRFGSDDGDDFVTDVGTNADTDRIIFDASVAVDDLVFARGEPDTFDLFIHNTITGSMITIDRHFVGANRGVEEIEFADGTTWNASDIANAASAYVGTENTDVFVGTDADEDINGRGGDDDLRGAKGSDTYRFGANDGADLISDVGTNADTDRIVFDASVAQGDLTFSRGAQDTYDLVITNNVTGASIAIDRHFVGANRGIEEIEFSDGTILTTLDIAASASPYVGTANADVFYGTDADEDITGAGGDDDLRGGQGSDTYRFGANDGADLISDVGTNADTDRIVFDASVAQGDLTFSRGAQDTYDLVITNNVTGASIAIDRHFVGANRGIEEIEFSDGTILTTLDIAASASPYVGTANADVFYGTDADEDITGAGGDDDLRGGQGSDTYRFGANDGADLISDVGTNADTDRIVFDSAVTPADLLLSHGVVDPNDLVITNVNTGSVITVDRHFVGANRGIEEIEFNDGTIWDAAEIDNLANTAPPVVLDLDGDGVELVSLADSRVRFDFDGDGLRERGGWVDADDGILALDRNGDGRIAGLSEISFIGDLVGARSDLEGLGAYDTNGDGSLTAADEQFNDFLVWQDQNGNGRSDFGELRSFDQLGIVELKGVGVAPANASPVSLDDNTVLGAASAHWEDGRVSEAADVALRYDDSNSLDRFADIREYVLEWFGETPLHGPFFNGRLPFIDSDIVAKQINKWDGFGLNTIKLSPPDLAASIEASDSADVFGKFLQNDTFDFEAIKNTANLRGETLAPPEWAERSIFAQTLDEITAAVTEETPNFGGLHNPSLDAFASMIEMEDLSYLR